MDALSGVALAFDIFLTIRDAKHEFKLKEMSFKKLFAYGLFVIPLRLSFSIPMWILILMTPAVHWHLQENRCL
jgi:hypothetical protein